MINFFETLERISLLHRLIKDTKTGNPKSLSKRLGISRATLYNMLDELKSYDAPIAYSRSAESFYYTKDFELDLYCRVQIIDEEVDLKKTTGGCHFFSSVCFFRRSSGNFTYVSSNRLAYLE